MFWINTSTSFNDFATARAGQVLHNDGTLIAGRCDVKRNVKCHEQSRTTIDRTLDPAKEIYTRGLESRLAALEESLSNLEWTVIARSEQLKRRMPAPAFAERELAMLAVIINATNNAVLSIDNQLRIRSCNQAAEQTFGLSGKKVIGRGLEVLTSPDQFAEIVDIGKHIIETGEPAKLQFRLRRNGITNILPMNAFPIHDETGKIISIALLGRSNAAPRVSVTQTVSDRHRIEAELRRARDEAKDSARAKSEFLANMSHEIRTPLNSIIGFSGLLLDTPLTAEQHEFVNDIRLSGDALLSLIDNILDFSKMSAGKLLIEEIDFNLDDVIEEIVEVIAPQARHKGLELTVGIEPQVLRSLRGDRGRLRQILLNLLSNAIKFTDHGEIGLAVNRIIETPQETVLRFEVQDTGIGIAPEKQSLLFKPFTQVDASTTRNYGGTGLGLSIVRELIEAMRGTISLASRLGEGSTFWFIVKLARQTDKGRPVTERLVPMTGSTVLLVDDNANSRQNVETLLSSWGMHVRSAASAEEGLGLLHSAAATEPYQIALVDVMMPGLDGIEMARRIQSVPALAKTTLIFMSSAGASPEFAQRLVGLDIAGWLMKPVMQSALYELIRSLTSSEAATSHSGELDRQQASVASGFKLPPWVGARVLLAEDNPMNQKVAKLQLAKIGLEVDIAGNGREAVEAALRRHYDLILMDCQMPELDGYEATRELRRREADGPHSKIIAMTAHAMPGDREKCLSVGMDAYISKPVTQQALEAALEELFQLDSCRETANSEALTSSQSVLTIPERPPTDFELPETRVAEDSRIPEALPPSAAAGKPSSRVNVDAKLPSTTKMSPIASSGDRPVRQADNRSGDDPNDRSDVCDRATLDELRAEGHNLLAELIEMFQTELTNGLDELTHALAARDCSAVARLAHTMKGTAGTLGAKHLHEIAARLDQTARAGQADQAATIFEEFCLESERVRRYLAVEIETNNVVAPDSREAH